MSFFCRALLSGLAVRLRDWRSWALLLLLPLAALGAARLAPPEEVSAPVQVGVVLPEEGGEEFWRGLQARSGLVVRFQPAGMEEARRQVGLGRWDCALILPADFQRRLEALDTQELITLLVGPGSTVYPMVRETAAACVTQCISPAMAEAYLLDSGILGEERLEEVRPRLRETLGEQDRVLVALETADGRALDPLTLADRGTSGLIAGLTAILLLIWVLLTAMDLGRWLESPFAKRLAPLQGTGALLLPRLVGALLPALCAGALALTAGENSLAGIPALVPYLLFWGGAALVLARFPALWRALPVLAPFVPVAGLLLAPVLLDLSLLFPALRPVVRWNPITLYLRACQGSWLDAAALAVGGGALILCSLGLDRKTERI